MPDVTYNSARKWLEDRRSSQHASEIHGLITGWICAGSRFGPADRREALSSWLASDLSGEAMALVEDLHEATVRGLADEEFGFRLLIPDDNTPLNDRTFALASWCSGFLSGFGMTGRYQQSDLNEDLSEIFADLSRISSFGDEVPEDDDNEADLVEIGEYVRMSALLVYSECADKSVH